VWTHDWHVQTKPTTLEEIKRIARVVRIMTLFTVLEMSTRLQVKGRDSLGELDSEVKLILKRDIDDRHSNKTQMVIQTVRCRGG